MKLHIPFGYIAEVLFVTISNKPVHLGILFDIETNVAHSQHCDYVDCDYMMTNVQT